MSGENCTATVTVVGIGTFTCERTAVGDEGHAHLAQLPSDGEWASVLWAGDAATIRQPGTRGGGA